MALGPSLARAMGSSGPAIEMTAVCSAGGWRWVALPASADADTPDPGEHVLAACPWCPPGGASLGAVPVGAAVNPAAVPRRPLAIAIAAVPVLRPTASTATARGPPAVDPLAFA